MDQDQDSWAKEYATVFMAEMIKRFPPTEQKDTRETVICGSKNGPGKNKQLNYLT